MSELAVDTISKSLIVSEILSKEVLEFRLRHQVFGLEVIFILVPLLDYQFAKEQGGERDLVGPVCPSGFEVILTLLAELIEIQI